MKTWRLGLNLMRTGRFSIKPESMEKPEKLASLFQGGSR
jgi:hypothetical protein